MVFRSCEDDKGSANRVQLTVRSLFDYALMLKTKEGDEWWMFGRGGFC